MPLSHKWDHLYINKIIKDANIQLIITVSEHIKTKLIENTHLILNLDEINFNNENIVNYQLEEDSQEYMSYCYIMYTSGSTGLVKGVKGTEDGILNRCKWMYEYYPHPDNNSNCDFR